VKILALTIRLLAVAPLLLLAAVLPGPSLAQTLEGDLTDRESGLPVDGALVLLIDGEGQELLGRISDEEGFFRMVAPIARTRESQGPDSNLRETHFHSGVSSQLYIIVLMRRTPTPGHAGIPWLRVRPRLALHRNAVEIGGLELKNLSVSCRPLPLPEKPVISPDRSQHTGFVADL